MCQLLTAAWGAGEYPLASSSASERAEANKALRFRRGEMVVCTFTMQVSQRQQLCHALLPVVHILACRNSFHINPCHLCCWSAVCHTAMHAS